MKIKFEFRGKELWLESDYNQFIVHEGFRESKDKETGKIIKSRINARFPHQFSSAIIMLLDKAIKRSDAETLKELLRDYTELKKLVLKSLNFEYQIDK